MGAVSLTVRSKYQEPFPSAHAGVKTVPYDDIDAMARQIRRHYRPAVFLEPILSRGAVCIRRQKEYLSVIREACDNTKALLVFDEVQVGMGRTGTLWAHGALRHHPDIMTSCEEPLGGGLPVGATADDAECCDDLQQAGRPLHRDKTSAGGALFVTARLVSSFLEKVSVPELLQSVCENGERFRKRLEGMRSHHAMIRDIRGRGLIWGIELDRPAAQLVAALRKRHTLACIAGPNVLRFLPPLVISDDQLHQVADQLNEAMTEVEAHTQQNAV